MIIAASGNVGSGKTTLAKFLVKNYGFVYVPSNKMYSSFINDFFDNKKEYFLPTQLSFLITKATEIREHYNLRRNIIVDRSLIEDIYIFAKYWMDNIQIENRYKEVYKAVADYLLECTPKPDAYFVSSCSDKISKLRIENRTKRDFESKYPPNHIKTLFELYDSFDFDSESILVEINSDKINYTDDKLMNQCIEYIFNALKEHNEHGDYHQCSFFENETINNFSQNSFPFKNYIKIKFGSNNFFEIPQKVAKKYIYFAAPFTSFAEENKLKYNKEETLYYYSQDNLYGVIPNAYREFLNSIAKKVTQLTGLSVLLPHRDINNWGKTQYPASYIVENIKATVEKASALIAIPGESIGVHLEIGLAISSKKPIVIFDVDDIKSSFFIDGLSSINGVLVKHCKSLKEITKQIDSEVLEFLNINLED